MKLLGNPVAQKIEDEDISPFTQDGHFHLAIVLVGANPNSQIYVREKVKAGHRLGLEVSVYRFSGTEELTEIQETLRYLNDDSDVAGTILQLPLPKNLAAETEQLISLIYQTKDVDSLTEENRLASVSFPPLDFARDKFQQKSITSFSNKFKLLKDFYLKAKILMPPTASAVMEILTFYKIDVQEVVLVGRGLLVGSPVAKLLEQMSIPFQVIHSQTDDREKKKILKTAKVIISGTSSTVPIFSSRDIANYAVVIDCAADFNHNDTKKEISFTPPIGGGGPVTVACLLRNVILAKLWQDSKK